MQNSVRYEFGYRSSPKPRCLRRMNALLLWGWNTNNDTYYDIKPRNGERRARGPCYLWPLRQWVEVKTLHFFHLFKYWALAMSGTVLYDLFFLNKNKKNYFVFFKWHLFHFLFLSFPSFIYWVMVNHVSDWPAISEAASTVKSLLKITNNTKNSPMQPINKLRNECYIHSTQRFQGDLPLPSWTLASNHTVPSAFFQLTTLMPLISRVIGTLIFSITCTLCSKGKKIRDQALLNCFKQNFKLIYVKTQ